MSESEETLKRLESKIDQLPGILERSERRIFYKGLIMGLVLGILGNFFVSYWMEWLKGFSIPFWSWTLGMVFSCLGIFLLIWLLNRESRR